MHRRLAFAFGLLATAGQAAALGAQTRDSAQFDAYVARAVKDWRVPGLAIAVVAADSVRFIKGYGVRELGKPDPVTTHTQFGVMSTTKAFTAMLVAQQVDSGRVSLDAPVGSYVPGFQLQDPYATRELTVRDLLTHRVGFGDPSYLWDLNASTSYANVVHRLRWVAPKTSLRSTFAYNNVAYAVAGDVAGRAAGTTWQALVRRRIYEPLGMTESFADGRELAAAHLADVSSPHGLVDDTVRVLDAGAHLVDPVAPAGAMFASITDMAKWVRYLLDTATANGHRGVSAAGYAELFRPQQLVGASEFYPTASLTRPHFTAYGLGWFLEDYRGEFVAFHTGSIEGRSAIVGLIPSRRVGVVILTNLDHSELRHALMYTVFDQYLGADIAVPHDWSAEMRTMYDSLAAAGRTAERAGEPKRVAGTRPTLALARYAGTYTDSLYGTATVRSTSTGGLELQAGTQRGALEHWHHDVFRVRWSDRFLGTGFVAFALDPDGSVGTLELVGGPLRYRRAAAATAATAAR